MLTRIYQKYMYWLFLLLFCSCEERYQPKVIDSPNRYLVVSGFINAGNAPVTIKLSRTRNLSEENVPLPETRAQVLVEEESGSVVAVLREKETGTYTSDGNVILNPSRKYRIFIKSGGKDYASAFVPVTITPPIDSVSWQAQEDGLQLYVNTHDPQNKTRYYRWEFEDTWEYTADFYSTHEYVGGQVLERDPANYIYQCWRSGRSTDIIIGNSIKLSQDVIREAPLNRIPSNSVKIKRKYSTLVRQYGLTREAFEYWDILKRNTESIGTLFDPLPSKLTGNIKCLTDPSEPVIGFVVACTIQEKRTFVSKSELPASWRTPSNYCVVDTIKTHELRESMESGARFLIAPYYSEMDPERVIGYFLSTRSCVDCTLTGTNIKPAFWE